ncbi:MAG: hypothetical protein A2075_22615 [Geobacteraceae bacterium GWC2_58_44]|nr:MAG: hypothetical protein A2075_22615 [Geobacteraceae bacterium GWC2_58_44]HBG07648.1 hypothetical protein [Geobacter sp.]
MKRLLLFLARLLGISLLFVPLLPSLHRCYKFVLAFITTATMPTGEMMEQLPYDGSNNLYTFLVLLLAIPGMEMRKRLIGIATGMALFLFGDFFMTAVWIPYLKTPRPSLANMAVSYGWLVVAHYLLPFLLWIVLSYRQIEAMCRRQVQGLPVK